MRNYRAAPAHRAILETMELRAEDLRIDHYRTATGADGVRLIHLPTGLSASVDDQPTPGARSYPGDSAQAR